MLRRISIAHRVPLTAAVGTLVVLATLLASNPADAQTDPFAASMQRGVAALQGDDLAAALAAFQEALTLSPGHPAALAWAGNVMALQGDPVGAEQALDAAIASAPDYLPARLFRARARELQGRLAGAADDLEAAVRIDPEDSAARAGLARVLMRTGRLDEAALHATELTRLAPAELASHFILAGIEQQRGRYEQALTSFRTANRLRPDDPTVLSGMAEALAGLGRIDDAFGALATLVETHPEDAHGWRLYGELLAANRFGLDARITAADFLARALELEPEALGVATSLAELYLELRVIERVLRVVAETPGANNDARLQFLAGRAYSEKRSYTAAVTAFNRSFELVPRPETLAYRAAAERNLDQPDLAIATLREAVALDPEYAPAWLDVGDLLLANDAVPEAVQALESATRLLPDNGMAWLQLGRALQRAGDPAAAIVALETSRELDDTDAATYYALGLAYRETGDAERSRQALGRFQELERTSGQGADEERNQRARGELRTGLVLYRLGDNGEAVARLRQAVDLAPEAEPGWFYLGLALARLEQTPEAIEALERAASLDPDRAASHEALAVLYDQLARTQDAEAARNRARALRAREQSTR